MSAADRATGSAEHPTPQLPDPAWGELTARWLAAYKANLDTLLALANAALAGAEKMRMAQLAADVETQTQNRQAAKEVTTSRDVPGVLAAQSHLSNAYAEGYVRYWAMMLEAARQTNADIARILAARAAEMGDELRHAFGAAAAVPGIPAQAAQLLALARGQQEAMLKAVSALAPQAAPGAKPGSAR
ncbi:MAG: phasin family protein [Burkholderiales bacterium]|nr:phasin family protein [Burkholderiales bacterium]